jgi:Skp family chaperone for outer membrane proteins
VTEFKNEVTPVARRLAQLKGLSVVMIKQNGMIYIAPEVDITEGVIDEMQKLLTSRE